MVVLGTSMVGRAENGDQANRARQFIVMGYLGIQRELMAGKGPYLKTLLELLGVSSENEGKTLEKLKTIEQSFPNIMDFADHAVALDTGASQPQSIETSIPAPTGPGIYSGEKLENALEHLTRGMAITVTLKSGEQVKGSFADYSQKRLWIRELERRSIPLKDILALEAPDL